MSESLIERIIDRYGIIGVIVVAIAMLVLFAVWILVVAIFPIALLAPVLVTAWMMWNVMGGDDD